MGAISLKLLVEGRRVSGEEKMGMLQTNITYEGIDFQVKKKPCRVGRDQNCTQTLWQWKCNTK